MNWPFLSGCHAQKSSVFRVQTGIFSISSASMGRKIDHTNTSFHDVVAGIKSSKSLARGFRTRDTIGLNGELFGIQLSP